MGDTVGSRVSWGQSTIGVKCLSLLFSVYSWYLVSALAYIAEGMGHNVCLYWIYLYSWYLVSALGHIASEWDIMSVLWVRHQCCTFPVYLFHPWRWWPAPSVLGTQEVMSFMEKVYVYLTSHQCQPIAWLYLVVHYRGRGGAQGAKGCGPQEVG